LSIHSFNLTRIKPIKVMGICLFNTKKRSVFQVISCYLFYKKTRMLRVFLGSVIVMLYLSSQGQTGAALFTTDPDSVCTLDERHAPHHRY
jgi:hypothetical protein